MTTKTVYAVITFDVEKSKTGRKIGVRPCEVIQVRTEDEAKRRAASIARHHAGAAFYSQLFNTEAESFEEPVILGMEGEVNLELLGG